MTTTTDPATARKWDAHADDNVRLFAPLTGHVARSMLSIVQGRLFEAQRILDIACGPGDLAVAAAILCAERGGGSVLATDWSPEMVALAERALAHVDADTICEVRDGQALGLEGGNFDAAFSCFGIFLFPDRIAGWRSAAEALRPGGLFVTSVWREPEFNEMARVQMAPLMAAMPKRLTEGLTGPPWADITTAEGLIAEVIGSASFEEPEIHVVEATLVVPTPNDMWRGMVGNPVIGGLIGRCAPDELVSVEQAVLASFEQWTGGVDRPLVLNASCHVLVARRKS